MFDHHWPLLRRYRSVPLSKHPAAHCRIAEKHGDHPKPAADDPDASGIASGESFDHCDRNQSKQKS
jgi:hypothetical protein